LEFLVLLNMMYVIINMVKMINAAQGRYLCRSPVYTFFRGEMLEWGMAAWFNVPVLVNKKTTVLQ